MLSKDLSARTSGYSWRIECTTALVNGDAMLSDLKLVVKLRCWCREVVSNLGKVWRRRDRSIRRNYFVAMLWIERKGRDESFRWKERVPPDASVTRSTRHNTSCNCPEEVCMVALPCSCDFEAMTQRALRNFCGCSCPSPSSLAF